MGKYCLKTIVGLVLCQNALLPMSSVYCDDGEILFRDKVAAILQSKCISCHNDNDQQGKLSLQSSAGFRKGGESGPIVSGIDFDNSLLIEYVLGDEPEMPKDAAALSAEEIQSLKDWVACGSPWPANLQLANRSVVDLDWWSLHPHLQMDLPPNTTNPIDLFVKKKHAQQGVTFSPEAEREKLIRRLYFDLIGLPPTRKQLRDFVESDNPTAYQEVVDQLLNSPRYGERWGRHWLDVVQYGETHGYDKDKQRMNAWPYRDYVIRAFNSDKPYSRFIKEQLAGDVLFASSTDGIVATGFISAGPWDFIGHAEVPESKVDGKVARNLDRDNMVTSTMNTFCSLTIQCARCHNHKLDPVTMDDYYSLQAVFASIDRAEREFDSDPSVAKQRLQLMQQKSNLVTRLDELSGQVQARKTPEIIQLEKEISDQSKILAGSTFPTTDAPKSIHLGYHSQVSKSASLKKWVQLDLGKRQRLDSIVLIGAQEYGWLDFGFPNRFVVECSDDENFNQAQVLADYRTQDFPRPGGMPVVIKSDRSGRFVRVTATKLWSRRRVGAEQSNDWIFALGELSVISGERIATAKNVNSLDSIEALPRWGKANLIDHQFGDFDLETKLGKSESPTNGYHSQFASMAEVEKWVKIDLSRPTSFDEIEILPAYPTDFKPTPGFGFPVRFKLEISADINFKDSVLVADQTQSDVMNPLTRPWRVHIDPQRQFRFIKLTATKLWNRGDPGGQNFALALAEINILQDGKILSKNAKVTASDSINSGRWNRDYLVDGFTSRLKINSAAGYLQAKAKPSDLQKNLDTSRQQLAEWLTDAIGPTLLEKMKTTKSSMSEIEAEISRLPLPKRVYAGTVHKGNGNFRGREGLGPREIRVLGRGNVTQPGKVVQPGSVPFIDQIPARFPLPDNHPEGQRRIALAEWITRDDNPLTWRSIVNRVWHYHFGKGIVDTPNDFGRGGGQPSHPALLDWLATEFRDGGPYLQQQSIKSLHRLICNSRTYKQSSQSTSFSDKDGDNRYLWRMNRRRLSAEEIHDSVLVAADLLDPKMYGPSYQDFVIVRPEHSPHYEYHLYDPYDPATHRRAVYRFIVRSQPQPFMDTLNCADPSSSVPKRSETLTALQALGMLNNRFMVAMADRFAKRLEGESTDRQTQIKTAFQLTAGRDPDNAEMELLEGYYDRHGLKNTCRVLFNINEFIFVD
jgi:hypothetical protein